MNKYKFKGRFNVKLALMVVFVLLLVGYGIFNARDLLRGPIIEVFSPAKNIETNENTIDIKGRAENTAFISLNEKPIFISPEGLFEEKLLLLPGLNLIEIKARDRFKKEIVKTIEVYYKQSTTTPAVKVGER